MKGRRSKRGPISAVEYVRQLEQDPAYIARRREFEEEREARIREYRRIEAPIIDELRNVGYDVESLDELRESGSRYTDAVPILVKWLPRISNDGVKQSIVRTLSVPWAKQAARPIIEEFRSAPETPPNKTSWKWTMGNALSVVADDSVFSDIVDLVLDKRHGRDREMLALALGKMRDARAVDVLIKLLEDDQVAGHAIIALRKLKAKRAAPYLEKFLSHSKSWVRREAKKALEKLRSLEK